MSFANKAIIYFSGLKSLGAVLKSVDLVNPYNSEVVKDVLRKFYKKYFNDSNKRLFVFGINPGRFGGGLTGISFTDPVVLREQCGVHNDLGERKELSSKFIYKVVDEFGGPKKFFSKVFLTALYPFAIIKDGKNYNYYDEKSLAEKLRPEIIKTINSQVDFGARKDMVILLGKKNAEFFSSINSELKLFKKIIVLEHPRFIMQYRLKLVELYINKYVDAISN